MNCLSSSYLGLSINRSVDTRLAFCSRKSSRVSYSKSVTKAFWGGKKNSDSQFQQQKQGGSYYPPVFQGQQQGTIQVTQEQLSVGTALRNIGWVSFWSQLILSTVSGVILLFSIGVTAQGQVQVSPLDACTLIGSVFGLVGSFLAWTWINTGRKLTMGQDVKLQRCMMTILASTNINLIGMGASILGLQATVGSLVGKTLTTAASYYGPRSAAPPVAFDIFSVQACANTIMAHFVGLVLANWLLRVISKVVNANEDFTPSAPPAPARF